MSNADMTLRIEPELQAQAAALFNFLGMDLSSAVSIFYRQALKCRGLPFEVKADEPKAVTCAAMQAAENNADMHGPYNSVREMMADLDS